MRQQLGAERCGAGTPACWPPLASTTVLSTILRSTIDSLEAPRRQWELRQRVWRLPVPRPLGARWRPHRRACSSCVHPLQAAPVAPGRPCAGQASAGCRGVALAAGARLCSIGSRGALPGASALPARGPCARRQPCRAAATACLLQHHPAAGGDREVTLLDYGAGNVRSVRNAITKLGWTIKDVRAASPRSWVLAAGGVARAGVQLPAGCQRRLCPLWCHLRVGFSRMQHAPTESPAN